MNKSNSINNKILLISLDFPPMGGGQGIYAENLAQKLIEKGQNITVLTTRSNNRNKYNFKIKEVNYRGQNPIIFVLLSYFYYIFNLKKENYNIIHGNSINHLLFLLFKEKNKKYITTVHNTYLQRIESKKKSFLYNLIYPVFIKLEKFVLKKTSKIVAVSENTRKYISKLTKNQSVTVIENGVNINKYRPTRKNSDIFRFLYVGRLELRKRVLETVKIFKEFLENYKGNKKFEFIIVGDGPEYKRISKYIKENNLNQIKLAGFSSDVKKHYDRANCLLLLSRGEGLPLVLLESISCGLSAIVTKDASGLSNAIQQDVNGYIVEDQLNKEEIINKINSILNNFEEFSNKSKKIALNYNWSIIIDKYVDIYNE